MFSQREERNHVQNETISLWKNFFDDHLDENWSFSDVRINYDKKDFSDLHTGKTNLKIIFVEILIMKLDQTWINLLLNIPENQVCQETTWRKNLLLVEKKSLSLSLSRRSSRSVILFSSRHKGEQTTMIRTLSKAFSNSSSSPPSSPSQTRRFTFHSLATRLSESKKVLLEQIPHHQQQFKRLGKRTKNLLTSSFDFDQRRRSSLSVRQRE